MYTSVPMAPPTSLDTTPAHFIPPFRFGQRLTVILGAADYVAYLFYVNRPFNGKPQTPTEMQRFEIFKLGQRIRDRVQGR
jgi:hypothetical protein